MPSLTPPHAPSTNLQCPVSLHAQAQRDGPAVRLQALNLRHLGHAGAQRLQPLVRQVLQYSAYGTVRYSSKCAVQDHDEERYRLGGEASVMQRRAVQVSATPPIRSHSPASRAPLVAF